MAGMNMPADAGSNLPALVLYGYPAIGNAGPVGNGGLEVIGEEDNCLNKNKKEQPALERPVFFDRKVSFS
jgi:hypothetical protein